MPKNWDEACSALMEFIRSNPGIKIEPGLKIIPREAREGFYNAFDTAREAFIRDYCSDILARTEELSQKYNEIAGQVTTLLSIESEIELNTKLKRLLENPLNGLMRTIYDPLFDLLKGKISDEEFYHRALNETESNFSALYKDGYNIWLILVLIKWLEPSDLMWVSQKEPNAINCLTEIYKPGDRTEPVPDVTKAYQLTFEPGTWNTFIVPDVIIYSRKLEQYVALRRSLPVNAAEPFLIAKQITEEREWMPFSDISEKFSLKKPWPSLLLYTDDDADRLRLIADCKSLLRPEMVIDVFETDDWLNPKSAELIVSHNKHLKPYSGMVVVSRKEIPKEMFNSLIGIAAEPPDAGGPQIEKDAVTADISNDTPGAGTKPEQVDLIQDEGVCRPDIELVLAGFNQQALAPVVEMLKSKQKETVEKTA